MSASRTTGRPSTPSRSCRAMASSRLLPPVEVELFGRRYAAPIGIAPMGGPSLVWPGADLLMARPRSARAFPTRSASPAAPPSRTGGRSRARRVLASALSLLPRTTTKSVSISIRRAEAAGAKVLTLTLDVPVRTTRSRETYAGLAPRIPAERAHDLRNAGAAALAAGAAAQRLSALRHHRRLCAAGARAPTRSSLSRAHEHGRRLHLGRGRALSRQVERPDGGEGHAASGRRREGGRARHRRHLGVEPRRPPDRGAGALDRRAAGDRRGGRQARRPSCSTAAFAAART